MRPSGSGRDNPGLGVPRETIQLVRRGHEIHLITSENQRDLTRSMRAWARRKVKEVSKERLSGFDSMYFSPDEKYLYVGNWDPESKVVMRYRVQPDGKVSRGEILFDMKSAPQEEAIDGIKVDQRGNLYISGPGGLWLLSPEGVHLGTIIAPRPIHNFAWGDEDGRTLYLTARNSLYRLPLLVAGARR